MVESSKPEGGKHDPFDARLGTEGWRPWHVYTMAVVSLTIGLLLGYLFRGSAARSAAVRPTQPSPAPAAVSGMQQMPTLDQMKHMGDKQAEPLLEKLKADPKNAALMVQVAHIYESVHQFKDAAGYYSQALEVDPKNVATRTEMASCLYYSGDVDGALGQLQQSLHTDPKDANSLFNLGMIKWNGKKDGKGAIDAWQDLLRLNPTLEPSKQAQVRKLIAEASQPQP